VQAEKIGELTLDLVTDSFFALGVFLPRFSLLTFTPL